MAYMWCDDCALLRADYFANSNYVDRADLGIRDVRHM